MNELKEPLVSIIMPVYNGEKYLEDTINAICESQYKNIEILCIDDCSRDNSVEICRKFAKTDARVRVYVRTENGGVAKARNTGLQICKGNYVCFADQDDIVSSDFYATMVRDIIENDCQVAISNVLYMVDGVPQDHRTIKKSCVIEGRDREQLLKWLVLDESVNDMPMNTVSKTVWNCMFDNTIIKANNVNFKRFVAYEDDWLFLLEIIKLAKRVFLEEKELYTWRIHKNQATQNPKYIKEYSEKRKKLRAFVFSQIEYIDCAEDEIQRYNVEYVLRLIGEGIINEVNTRTSWNSTALKSAEMNLNALWKSMQQYLTNETLKNIRRTIWKKNSFYNAIPQILVTYKLYLQAIRLQRLRNFAIRQAKKAIKEMKK